MASIIHTPSPKQYKQQTEVYGFRSTEGNNKKNKPQNISTKKRDIRNAIKHR